MFVWPKEIVPLPSVNFSVDAEFSNIRSQMDSGRARQRPRFTTEIELAKVRFELDRTEYALFKSFWVLKLNNGNDWFKMDLPIADGDELTETEIRFVSDYSASYKAHANWDISATIEFKETGVISIEMVELILALDNNTQTFFDVTSEMEEEIPHIETIHPW